jgi:hypothetical protein
LGQDFSEYKIGKVIFIMTNKQKYRRFCETEKDMPIFSKGWWLDAVCGEDNWDVVLVEKGGHIVASMPYYNKKKAFFNLITMPKLTQTMGPYIKYPENQKYSAKLSCEKKIIKELISQLPGYDYFSQNFHYYFTNWLPFYWQGFEQTTRYTYVLDKLSDLDILWKNMKENIRTDIRKAKELVRIDSDTNINDFFSLHKKTFARQNMAVPYTQDFVKQLDEICHKNSCRKIFIARDGHGNEHAAVYIIWDNQSAYYLMGGGDHKLRNSGATSLLMWEAIKFAATVTKRFDFEGSMIQPIEKFFSAFGANQTPYLHIQKTNSKLLKIRQAIKSFRK